MKTAAFNPMIDKRDPPRDAAAYPHGQGAAS